MNVLVDQKQVPPRPALQRRHNLHHLISTMFFVLTNIKNTSAMLVFAMHLRTVDKCGTYLLSPTAAQSASGETCLAAFACTCAQKVSPSPLPKCAHIHYADFSCSASLQLIFQTAF